MSWMRVDDGLSEHPKVEALEAEFRDQQRAMSAWVLVGSACHRRKTHGVVTRSLLAKTLGSWPEKERLLAAEALVRVRLWEVDPAGWRFHDWDEYSKKSGPKPTGQALSGAERMARLRAKRDEDDPPTHDASDAVGDAVNSVTHTVTSDGGDDRARAHDPDPTKPDPTNPVQATEVFDIARFDRSRPGALGRLADHIQRAVGDAQVEAGGARTPLDTSSRWHRLAEFCLETSTEPSRPMPLADVVEQLARGWVTDAWASKNGFPIGALLGNPQKYFAGPLRGPTTPSHFTPRLAARVVTAADLDDDWVPEVANG